MTLEDRPCPWRGCTVGYRDLTRAESRKLLPQIVWQSIVSGAYNAVLHPQTYIEALQTHGSEMCCRCCNNVVRICPNCDNFTRWINASMLTCRSCETVFM